MAGNFAAAPVLFNQTLTNANTEYSIALPAGCTHFEMQARTNANVRFAFETGYVATPTAPYETLKAGYTWSWLDQFYLGSGRTSADSPSRPVTVQSSGGKGTNIAGAGLTLAGGKGTGTGAGGALAFAVAPAGASGSNLNSLFTWLSIASTKLGTFGEAADVALGTTTGTKWGTATTQKQAWWGATPVVQPSAYTQTYSTADKTFSAYTADDESAAYTGIDNAQVGTVYAQLTDLNALRTAYETLRAFAEDGFKMLNSVVDDLQTIGLVG